MLTTYPMRISQRRLRINDLNDLRVGHEIVTEQVTDEDLRGFTLSSLLVLNTDLEDAVKRYAYAQPRDPALAEKTLVEIHDLLIDAYAHIAVYFGETSSLPAFSRHVNRTCTRGGLSRERVISIKAIRRIR